MGLKKYIWLVALFIVFNSCTENRGELTILDIEIFKNTPAWEFAKALEKRNLVKAEGLLLQDSTLVDYQDPFFGTTLLMRFISTENLKAVRFLLKNGANPNIQAFIGDTALFRAIEYPWNEFLARTNSTFTELLLENGADPNQSYCGPGKYINPIECGTSPLMQASIISLRKTQLIFEAGGELNYKTKSKFSAAINALLMQEVEIAHYLIVEKKAEVTSPYYFYYFDNNDVVNFEKPHLPIELLKKWLLPLGSREHKIKMKIVEEFSRQGQDYWSMEKHPSTIEQIKKIYPANWKEYLMKY